jgi:hypothetical protein
VYYPSRMAFVRMQADERYVGAIPDRTEGLRARLLYPFALPNISGPEAAEQARSSDGEVTVFQLLMWADGASSNAAEALLQLPAGGPGLVTDGQWDELRVLRYASTESSRADTERRANVPGAADQMVVTTLQAGAL